MRSHNLHHVPKLTTHFPLLHIYMMCSFPLSIFAMSKRLILLSQDFFIVYVDYCCLSSAGLLHMHFGKSPNVFVV